MEELYRDMFDANVRIEDAWPFPMSPAPERLREAIAETDIDQLPEQIRPYFERLDEESREELADGWRGQDILDDLCGDMFCNGLFGWLGIAATPVMTPHPRGGASFSWGHYHTHLIFGASGDELIRAAVVWAEQMYAEDCPASGIEAATADETALAGSAEGESAVGAEGAETPNPRVHP